MNFESYPLEEIHTSVTTLKTQFKRYLWNPFQPHPNHKLATTLKTLKNLWLSLGSSNTDASQWQFTVAERERESNQIGSTFWGSDAKHQDLLLMFLTSLTLLRLDKSSRILPWQQIKKPFIWKNLFFLLVFLFYNISNI